MLVELGVVIGKTATQVKQIHALEYVQGFVCAVDVTARNWQKIAKEHGRPWSLAKGCDTFCPVSHMVHRDVVEEQGGCANLGLYLDVNGERRQEGNTSEMIWSVPELIESVTRYVTLEKGDLVLTGTPDGVGEIRPGDTVRAGIEGVVEWQVAVDNWHVDR